MILLPAGKLKVKRNVTGQIYAIVSGPDGRGGYTVERIDRPGEFEYVSGVGLRYNYTEVKE